MYNDSMPNLMSIRHNLPTGSRNILCRHIFEDRYIVLESPYITSDVVTGDVVRVKLSSDIDRPVLEIVKTLGRFKYIMKCRACKGHMLAPVKHDDCTFCKGRNSLDVTWSGYIAGVKAENFRKKL